MKYKGKIAIPAILAICILTLLMSSASAHPRTFDGYVYYANGTPCTAIDLVEIINTNTSEMWNQSTLPTVIMAPGYNVYQLTIDEPNDVNPGNIMMYYTVSGTQTNTSYCTFLGSGVTSHDIYLKPTVPTGIINVEPPSQNVSLNDSFTINITVNPLGNEIYSVKYDLFFNPSVVNATSQTAGTFLSPDGASTTVTQNEINSTLGKVTYNETRIDVATGVTTPGTLASITFEAIEPGTSNLDLSSVVLSDPSGTSIEIEINNGTVLVEEITIPEPDLIVAEIPDQLLFANVSNNVTAVIKNNGSADACSFNVSLYVNGTCIDKDVIAGLDAGNSTEVSFAWMPSETGNYILAVNADCDGDIAESNETNNELSKVVSVVEASSDLTVTSIDAYHRVATPYEKHYPCYNRSNEVDVTLKNEGINVDGFNVTLYADDEFIEKKQITGLGTGEEESVRFYWTPIGLDCVRRVNDTVWISESGGGRNHNLKVIVDPDDDVSEINETNNQLTKIETAHWDGYLADEPIENVGHGRLRGGLYYTTGDSSYLGPLHPGQSRSANYNITLPPEAEVRLARLNVYYTWSAGVIPEMEVSLTTPDGTTYDVTDKLEKTYNDRKCWGGFDYFWGNYVFNLTSYITENGLYNLTLTNVGPFSVRNFCPAGRGLVIIYEDNTKPEIEYWINEGADILEYKISKPPTYEEHINRAVFPGQINGTVAKATLYGVAPWGYEAAPWEFFGCGALYLNDIVEAGGDFYGQGWDHDLDGDGIIDVHLDQAAQVGMSVGDVTDYLNDSDNFACQNDTLDGMMPANAFLVVEYIVEEIYNVSITSEPDEQTTTPNVDATYVLTITNNGNVTDTIRVNITENEADAATISVDTLILNANEAATVYLNVCNVDVGIYNTSVRATSEGNPSVFEDVTVKTTVVTAGLPTADYLELPNASGMTGTYVEVPVNIVNVRNGPLQGIRLTVDYAESVLNLTSISSGVLTSNWTSNLGIDGHTVILATKYTNEAIPDGSSGSVVLLKFSVLGSPGDTSPMNLSAIELSNPDGEVGTAQAKNGTFTVTELLPPTADYLELPNASGMTGTYVEVPVNIINVQNGPIQGIRFDVDYDESVLDMMDISSGDLTSTWTRMKLGDDGHTIVIATDNTNDAIPDGSSGSIVLLNFSVLGSPGDTSPMNLSAIELSNPDGEVGTAPAKNGTFTVPERGSIEGRITYICNETGIAGVSINMTNADGAQTTLTNETGYYRFTDVSPDDYVVSATKPRFWDNVTDVTVTAGEVTTADMVLCLKGDLNDDGYVADAGDVMLMLQASTRDISGDDRYDLNGNGVIADAGDVVLILRASVGDIILW